MTAEEYIARGYMPTSNKYRILVRIDRPDWLQRMAARYNRTVADFCKLNGSGKVSPSWARHYACVFSDDKVEGVPQPVYDAVKKADRENRLVMGYVPENADELDWLA